MQTGIAESKVVIFRVGSEEYAVSIAAVKEVVPWTKPTVVPEAPPVVEGVLDLRGEIIPVIDLGRLFRTARRNGEADSRIIVMEVGGHQAGFIVDEVTEVHTVREGSVAPPSPVLYQVRVDGVAGKVVTGILKHSEGRLVVLVDAERILAASQAVGL